MCSFKREGLRDDSDNECTNLFRDLRDDSRSARAGAAAHTAGYEDHIASGERFLNLLSRLFGSALTELRVHTRTEPARKILADMDSALRERAVEVLCIGIDGDKFDTAHLRRDHMINRIFPRTADTDDTNPCERLNFWFNAF